MKEIQRYRSVLMPLGVGALCVTLLGVGLSAAGAHPILFWALVLLGGQVFMAVYSGRRLPPVIEELLPVGSAWRGVAMITLLILQTVLLVVLMGGVGVVPGLVQ